MKLIYMQKICVSISIVMCFLCYSVTATQRYVWQDSPSPSSPYASWQTAAHTIQAAVNVAEDDDHIFVTNGIYTTGGATPVGHTLPSRVVVTRPITIESVNGPDVTIIYGEGPVGIGATRCAFLTNYPTLIGFTFSNGHTRAEGNDIYDRSGGGVLIAGNAALKNCRITHNNANYYGGGAYLYGGGDVRDSSFSDNHAWYGGGAFLFMGGFLGSSSFQANVATNGGGAFLNAGDGILFDCLFANNRALNAGGGFYMTGSATLALRCEAVYNTSDEGGGAYNNGGKIYNSLFYKNGADRDGGGVFMNGNLGLLINSTIADNYAYRFGGGIFNRLGGSNINCIIYHNSADNAGDNYDTFGDGTFLYTCTTPLPSGVGNIADPPLFVGRNAADYHLSPTSPCIDTGSNALAAPGGLYDLEGRQRILGSPIGLVDMGCFEYVPQDSTPRTRYVHPDRENIWPYASENNAARTIQDAIDAAQNGDTIVIASGTYARGYRARDGARSRLLVTKNLTLIGDTDNPESVRIVGAPDFLTHRNGTTAVRGAYLTQGALRGVTLSNGFTHVDGDITALIGGGALLVGNISLSDAQIVRNHASGAGGGVAAINGGTVADTLIAYNHAGQAGGGVLANLGGAVYNSLIRKNTSVRGAGAYLMDEHWLPSDDTLSALHALDADESRIHNCHIIGNMADEHGGGVYFLGHGSVRDVILENNGAYTHGGALFFENGGTATHVHIHNNSCIDYGAGAYMFRNGYLANALIVSNVGAMSAGGVFQNMGGLVESATIVYNQSIHGTGGLDARDGGVVQNAIIYDNTSMFGTHSNFYAHGSEPRVLFSCTTPLPESPHDGGGNIIDDPEFVNPAAGDFRLLSFSPCVDTGTNIAWMTAATDLDGNPRIYNMRTDMGAFEFIPEPSMFIACVLLGYATYRSRHRYNLR